VAYIRKNWVAAIQFLGAISFFKDKDGKVIVCNNGLIWMGDALNTSKFFGNAFKS
jgi:hypothetical protein